ncbi:MAG: CapA family protein, partial [Thermomicrobium sp.]|nr:CapA family protein [Thermomicrobium sp.]
MSFYRPSAARRIPAALAPTLSRRSFLALASSILACQETQPRTDGASLEDSAIDTPARQRPAIDHRRRRAVRPRLTVSIAPLPPTLHRQAEGWVARLRRAIPTHWDLVCTATGQGLFRLFATHGNPEHPVVGGRSFVPVTSHDNLAPGLSRAELRALLAGEIENWRALGHPENLTVHRASFEFDGFRLPVPHARYRDVGSLGRTIEPGFFALVEPHAVEPRLRVLAIEGVDPFRAPRGAPVTPELVEWLVVEGPLELLPESGRRAEAIPAPVYGTITFVGDIILGRTVHRIMSTRSDWASPFRLVAEELRWSDLTIGNLECALTDRYAAPSDPHTLRFLTLPRAVEGLQLAGIDAVSLANNHSLDFGWLALEDTRRTLDGVGIRTFGVGDYLEEALDPVFLHAGTALVALLGFDGIAA